LPQGFESWKRPPRSISIPTTPSSGTTTNSICSISACCRRRPRFVVCVTAADTAKAIKDMVVRGAPAIGVTAAYGVVLAARDRFAADAEAGARPGADIELLAASPADRGQPVLGAGAHAPA
jgi:hypothetical protein